MKPADSTPGLKLDYQSPASRPRSKVRIYLGRIFLAVAILFIGVVLYFILMTIVFEVTIGPAPIGN